LRADQCRRWQRGERPLVEAHLEGRPALAAAPEAVLDLIDNEVLLREADRPSSSARTSLLNVA
jgi:hypothetical protein